MNTLPLFIVDAFASAPFTGNPAAVCLPDSALQDSWMQSMAMEMNLSETAYVVPQKDRFSLRWFTPLEEVDLCGHATLASAHVLWEQGIIRKSDAAVFETQSGILTCARSEEQIEMDFPAIPFKPSIQQDKLEHALGCSIVFSGKSGDDLLVEVESEEAVRSIAPRFALLAQLSKRGVIVTSQSESDSYDIVSRFFAPRVGINEDPVTGSAHCALAPYWNSRTGKTSFTAYQASRRGGFLDIELRNTRVLLRGKAITTLSAQVQPEARSHTP